MLVRGCYQTPLVAAHQCLWRRRLLSPGVVRTGAAFRATCGRKRPVCGGNRRYLSPLAHNRRNPPHAAGNAQSVAGVAHGQSQDGWLGPIRAQTPGRLPRTQRTGEAYTNIDTRRTVSTGSGWVRTPFGEGEHREDVNHNRRCDERSGSHGLVGRRLNCGRRVRAASICGFSGQRDTEGVAGAHRAAARQVGQGFAEIASRP